MANQIVLLTYEQMSKLADRSVLLLYYRLDVNKLMSENEDALNKVNCPLGSNPSHKSVATDALPSPKPRFMLKYFTDPAKRQRSFGELNRLIDAVETRITRSGLKDAFDRSNQLLDTEAYNELKEKWSKQFSDYEHFLKDVESFIKIVNELQEVFLEF